MEDWADLLKKRMMGDYSAVPSDKHKSTKQQPKAKPRAHISVIDLHFNSLPEHVKKGSQGSPLDIQLNYAEEQLRTAASAQLSAIILIHGLGDGKLEQSLKKRYKNHHLIQRIETIFDMPYNGNALKLHLKQ